MQTKAHLKATNKWIKESFDRFTVRLPKGGKDKIKARADSLSMSLNAYIVGLIEKNMLDSPQNE